jgi:hypothetical protein
MVLGAKSGQPWGNHLADQPCVARLPTFAAAWNLNVEPVLAGTRLMYEYEL